jgi:hypothetical protein
MPEGPSIVILKELAAPFRLKKVVAVTGNSKVEKERAQGQIVIDFKSWESISSYASMTLLLKFILCYGVHT